MSKFFSNRELKFFSNKEVNENFLDYDSKFRKKIEKFDNLNLMMPLDLTTSLQAIQEINKACSMTLRGAIHKIRNVGSSTDL